MLLKKIVKQPWAHNYLRKKKDCIFLKSSELSCDHVVNSVHEHNSRPNPFYKNQFDSLCAYCVCWEINSNPDKKLTDEVK